MRHRASTARLVRPRREPDEDGPADLRAVLTRAVSDGVIDQPQADAILDAEARRTGPVEREGEGRVRALVAEALGYVGGALAGISAILLVQRAWGDLRPSFRVALLGVVAVVLLATGAAMHRRRGALARLAGFLWFLASGATAATVAVAGADLTDLDPAGVAGFAGTVTVVVSVALWRRRPATLQQLATFAGAVAAVVGVVGTVATASPEGGGLLVWALGILWIAATYGGLIDPVASGYAIGAAAALAGPFVGASDDETSWIIFLGLATAGALVAVSIPLRRTGLLGMGTFGLFLFIPRVVFGYFGEALGAPVALFLTGAALLGVALVMARLHRGTAGPDERRPDSVTR